MRKLLIAAIAVLLLVPAAASAAGGAFTDDDDSVFEDDIEWLAGAGVTLGCNPPTNDNFCPDGDVKRGQMAAFMRRFAAYLGAEDGIVNEADNATNAANAANADNAINADNATNATNAANADNADTVDGFDANGLVRAAGTVASGDVNDWDGSSALTTNATIVAPTDGFLIITFVASLGEDFDSTGNGLGDGVITIEVDGVQQGGVSWWSFEFGDPVARDHISTVQRLVPVAAGNHSIDGVLGGSGLTATKLVYVYERSLTVLFVPFDGTGAVAVPAAAGATSVTTQQKQS
jgi:hypothetical protein